MIQSGYFSPSASNWVVFPKPNPKARFRLFCFPYAGAGPVVYRSWVDSLPHHWELISLLYPGRESRLRETPFVSFRPLLGAMLVEIAPYLDRPFAFYGHSLGGLIAFGLARALRSQSAMAPIHLFISSRRAAHLPDPHPPIHGLSDAAFAEEVQQRYNNIPTVIRQDPELLALFLPILKADFSILETYQYTPGPAFDFPISAYGGLQDPTVSQEELAAWQQHTSQGFSLQMFPGDHFFIQSQREPLLQAILKELLIH